MLYTGDFYYAIMFGFCKLGHNFELGLSNNEDVCIAGNSTEDKVKVRKSKACGNFLFY